MLGYIGYPLCLLAHYLPAKYSVMHIPDPAGITQTYSEIRETFRLPSPATRGLARLFRLLCLGAISLPLPLYYTQFWNMEVERLLELIWWERFSSSLDYIQTYCFLRKSTYSSEKL